MPAALQFNAVTKAYFPDGITRRPAVKSATFTIEANEFVVIVGGNGSGKSTLLGLISGDVLSDAGGIYLLGANVTALPAWARSDRVALVRQNPLESCASDLTVHENLCLAAVKGKRWNLLSRAESTVASLTVNRVVSRHQPQLKSLFASQCATLSGGERQIVALTMAALRGCQILLLDEHLAALDAYNARRVLDYTREMAASGNVTTLMVTHDLNLALSCASRLLIMAEGCIASDFSNDELRGLNVADILPLYGNVARV